MGQTASTPEAPTRPDKRQPGDAHWPIIGTERSQSPFAYVKGMPMFKEESSGDLDKYQAYTLSADAEFFLPYWRAFKRDYGAHIEVLHHEPFVHEDRTMSVVFKMDTEIARKILTHWC